jgi:hypothetical protein
MQTNIDAARGGCAIDAMDGSAAKARKYRRLNESIATSHGVDVSRNPEQPRNRRKHEKEFFVFSGFVFRVFVVERRTFYKRSGV